MKKHVLFIVENNPVPRDIRVWSEAMAVKEMGYDVTAICPQSKRAPLKYEKIDGIDIYRHFIPFEASGKFGFLIEYINALFWELLLSFRIYIKKPFHIIHGANPPDHIFIIALFYKLFGVKYIFDHHDICPENFCAKFDKGGFFFKILLYMEKLSIETANIVISTNESYKKIAMERCNKHKDKVIVVRNGPDLSRMIFMDPNDGLKNGFDYLVAYVGVIGNQEGIDNLLNAVKYIVFERKIENIKFTIVGTGPDWKNVVALSKKMKLDKYVNFTGYIPKKELHEIFATADICVNPEFRNSFTDKSTMIKVMEYMTFGNPIVQFKTKEGAITAAGAAINVGTNDEKDFAEAIIDLLKDQEKRKRMGEIGRKRIYEELCWAKQKVNLERAYSYLEKNG